MYLDIEKYQYYMIDSFGRKIYAKRNPLQKETVLKQLPLNEPDIVNGKELLSFSEKMKKDVPF
jgi:phenolic acid decarboxylase